MNYCSAKSPAHPHPKNGIVGESRGEIGLRNPDPFLMLIYVDVISEMGTNCQYLSAFLE